jgi:hypothetical protein
MRGQETAAWQMARDLKEDVIEPHEGSGGRRPRHHPGAI